MRFLTGCHKFRLLLSVLILMGLLMQCASSRRHSRVILISIDTCRRDHWSCYGFNQTTTPHIDQLARQSTRFENAYSPVPITLPAHCSLFTGQIPPAHGVRNNSYYGLPEPSITLAEKFREQGYRTAAFVSSLVLDHRFGLSQGFDLYQDQLESGLSTRFGNERTAEDTCELALQWLDQNHDQKFFLFLHFYDPHAPYDPPERLLKKFSQDPYSGEIARVDESIGKIMAFLEQKGILDSSLIIITADHGEMLGEHGEAEHMYFVYESALRIPLIIHTPGQSAPRTIAPPVSLIDIFPTLCDWINLPLPRGIQGESLKPWLNGQSIPSQLRYFYAESVVPTYLDANPLQTVLTRQWKLIRTTRSELYQLSTDPEEKTNLIDTNPELIQSLQIQLDRMLASLEPTRPSVWKSQLDVETLNRLASLGYVATPVAQSQNGLIDPKKTDPKDLITVHSGLQEANALKFQNQPVAALEILNSLVQSHPHSQVFNLLGEMAREKNDPVLAQTFYSQSLRMNPRDYHANFNLGVLSIGFEKFPEAAVYFQQAAQVMPTDVKSRINLGIVLKNLNRLSGARSVFQDVLSLDPQNAIARKYLQNINQ